MRKLLILLLLSLYFIPAPGSDKGVYTILVSIDGFRWDYKDRGISPNMKMLGDEGVTALSLHPVFPSLTFPNHISIMTGMYAENHGIIGNYFYDKYSDSEYALWMRETVVEPRWYLGEFFWETAQRNGIRSATYFWPGSEIESDYRQPDYFKEYDGDIPYGERVEQIIEWLKVPYSERPKFLTLYFESVDKMGHSHGPDSPQVDSSITIVDGYIGLLVSGLEKLGIRDSTNLIIVSDHGMTEISKERFIDISLILNDDSVQYVGSGALLMLFPKEDKINEIYMMLKKAENNYKVYLKKDIPLHYHFSKHPFISPILVIANLGWSVGNSENLNRMSNNKLTGMHGFDNSMMDMHGFFIANGPAFKNGLFCESLDVVDIYSLLCEIFDIEPRSNIDGSINNIKFILK